MNYQFNMKVIFWKWKIMNHIWIFKMNSVFFSLILNLIQFQTKISEIFNLDHILLLLLNWNEFLLLLESLSPKRSKWKHNKSIIRWVLEKQDNDAQFSKIIQKVFQYYKIKIDLFLLGNRIHEVRMIIHHKFILTWLFLWR